MTPYQPVAPRIVCANGTSLSVQASRTHYCHPRRDFGPYEAVEVGFIQDKDGNPLSPPASWRPFAEGGFEYEESSGEWRPHSRPVDVHAYVPVDLVEEFIASQGGRV